MKVDNLSWRVKTMIIFAICFLFTWPVQLYAEDPSSGWMKQQAGDLPTDEVEQYWQQLMKQYGGFFPDQNVPHSWRCCYTVAEELV